MVRNHFLNPSFDGVCNPSPEVSAMAWSPTTACWIHACVQRNGKQPYRFSGRCHLGGLSGYMQRCMWNLGHQGRVSNNFLICYGMPGCDIVSISVKCGFLIPGTEPVYSTRFVSISTYFISIEISYPGDSEFAAFFFMFSPHKTYIISYGNNFFQNPFLPKSPFFSPTNSIPNPLSSC